MSRPFSPQVLTANALWEGDAVWRDAAGGWSTDFADAQVFDSPDTAAAALSEAAADAHLIVGPYLADIILGPDGPQPAHFREAFRTRGPSNYAHGKQEYRSRSDV